jgi:hypothetical protein
VNGIWAVEGNSSSNAWGVHMSDDRLRESGFVIGKAGFENALLLINAAPFFAVDGQHKETERVFDLMESNSEEGHVQTKKFGNSM